MANKKSSMRNLEAAGKPVDKSLGKALLKLLGAGLAIGAVLIAGGEKVGEKIAEDKEDKEEK